MDRNGYIGRAPADSAITIARQTFSPTGVTTDFTFVSGYTVGYLDLFLNGTKLIEGLDFTATDTSTISLISPATNGDILEGVAYKAFNLGNTNRIGIQSAGVLVGNAEVLNFVGTGNSVLLNGSTVDVQITGGGGGSGVASTITVADESSDTTCFPVFVTAASGDLNPKSGSNLTFNSSNGTLSATTFNGNISGATGSFTGNVSVGGTLTYDDVTNVDSVGIITAQTGIRVSAGGLVVAGVSTLAADLSIADKIIHTGDTNTAIRFSSTDTIAAETAGSEKVRINSGVLVTGIASATALAGFDYLQAPFSSTVTFTVTVASKDSSHRYNGTGSGNAYLINGVQAPFLTLTPGRTYRFTNDNTGSHPFKFYLEADKTTEYTSGVNFQNTYTEITITDSTPQVLHYQCASHGYMGNAVNTNSNVAATQATGISTAAATVAGIVTTLDLSSAQDHKLTVSGISTVTVTGGTEGESHTVRIINSGITTVGFSTFFLFPSGSSPSLPTADGAISLISFTVNRVGAGGTQLLAGAALNFS